MVKVIDTPNLPVKVWATHIESEAMKQIYNLAYLPFAFKHIAIMPDCHTGMGMPIGGVVALENAICPNMVGMDVGCGVIASKLDTKKQPTKEQLTKIVDRVKNGEIPVGLGKVNPKEFLCSSL